MQIQPVLLALLIILVFAGMFLLAIRASLKEIAEKTHLALTLGYQEVTTRPSHLISRVESLYKRRENQGVSVDQVYSKQERGQEFFIFNAGDSSDDDHRIGSEIFGVISNQLALPHFSMTTLPGFDSNSLIGGLMEKLLDKVLDFAGKYQGLSRIEFPDRPEVNDQVIVFGKEEAAVRNMIDRIPLSSITRVKSPLHIAGQDDFLTVDFSLMGSSQDQEGDLIFQHQEFTRILSYFTIK